MEKKKGLGIATLVIAIIGLLGCWIPFLNFISIFLFIVAIIMGIVAAIKDNGRVLAIVGIVLAIIGWFIGAKINGAVVDVVTDTLKEMSGDIVVNESGELESTSGLFSSFVDEINAGIQQGVEDFSEGVNEVNDQIIEGVNTGAENLEEGIETVGETLGEGVETINEALTGEEAE